jgi:hypothetical protein
LARFRKIDIGIHSDEKYRRLSDRAKLLWFTLLTFTEMTPLGAMRFTESGMAEYMGWDLKGFQKPFGELLGEGMAKYDPDAHFLYLPNFLRYNPPDNPNVVKSWAKLDGLLPECSLRDEYIQIVKGFLEGYGKGFVEAFPEGIWKGISKGSRKQEQEQELIPREQERLEPPPISPPKTLPKGKKLKKEKTPLSSDFAISEEVKKWAEQKGYKNLELHLETFKDLALSRGYEYVDWDRAFMRAIRENWGKISPEVIDHQKGVRPPLSEPKGLAGLREWDRRKRDAGQG